MDSLDGLVLKGIHPSPIIDVHAKEIEQNQIIHGFPCLVKDIGIVNSVPHVGQSLTKTKSKSHLSLNHGDLTF